MQHRHIGFAVLGLAMGCGGAGGEAAKPTGATSAPDAAVPASNFTTAVVKVTGMT
jgi:hypothetical protein